jgi:signal peptidase II
MTAFWILTALTITGDRVTKLIAQYTMAIGQHIVVFPGVLELRFTHNTGMALGLLSGHVAAGLILPVVAVGFGMLVLRRYKLSHFILIAAGLILGGFFGNFLDRVIFGYVVDMIYFPWLPFFICNMADVAITAGAVLFGISLLFRGKDWQEKAKVVSGDDPKSDG